MVSAEANTATKASTSTRRRKIEIKKVEQQNRRHVTFSKRKLGLFNKVTELSILCQAEIALIVTSPNGKLYACGYPTPDTVIQRFLTGGNPVGGGGKRKQQQQQEEMVETLRLQYEAIQDQLKEEKKNLQAITEAQKSSSSFPSWWHSSIDDMGLECLEHFKTSLEHLKLNLVTAVDEKRFNPLPPLPLQVVAPPPPPTMSSNYSLLSATECFGGQQQQARDWNCGSGSSSGSAGFMVPGFGHYWQHGSL